MLFYVANFNKGRDKDKTVKKKIMRAGRLWTPNKVVLSNDNKHKKMVLASKRVNGETKYKVLKFGAKGYGHNYSAKARKNYLARSGGIRNKSGELTSSDKFSKN